MSWRAIDFHVHLPTPDWLDGSMGGYVEAAEAYFRSPAHRQSLPELADQYRRLQVKAVLLAWDAEAGDRRAAGAERDRGRRVPRLPRRVHGPGLGGPA